MEKEYLQQVMQNNGYMFKTRPLEGRKKWKNKQETFKQKKNMNTKNSKRIKK